MKSNRFIIVAALVFSALFAAPAPAAPAKRAAPRPSASPKAMTPEQIISEIHNRFMKQKFRTMTYDETRVVSNESITPGKKGVMDLNFENGATYVSRYFYQAPAKHGYRELSNPIKNYWIGSPNQPGALPMDEKWKDKVVSWFNLYISTPQMYRGINCYRVTLVPKPGAPKNLFNMTWYIDPNTFSIIKFIFLIADDTNRVSSTGQVYYKPVNNYMLPYKAIWRTTVKNMPYIFLQKTTMKNYRFNIPLDESVFKEEFPDDWFKNLKEKPYAK
ncbi:MAG: hypothetical protein WCX65_19310 [bacterium]